jgi:hypothetical protein
MKATIKPMRIERSIMEETIKSRETTLECEEETRGKMARRMNMNEPLYIYCTSQ